MAVSKDFQAFVAELLDGLGDIRFRRMFGGVGAFKGDRMFALLADEQLWIKADPQAAEAFEAEGCPEFTYPMKDGSVGVLHYRRLPDAALDDPDEAVRWARLGVEAAHRKAAAEAPRRKGR